ncbi:MAG: alpha/beta hydrolase [Oscillospiraceae bacterium]|nr:alpha/beta hydrolase [Oscillospiraceae bacterium]
MITEYGTKIQVGKGKINVYSEGNGDNTIIMLSGAGVSSPVLEYRPLYRRMSDKYRIAVIEKSGYGLTESTGTARTVENMVNESREALRGADIKPPYILMAHSYSGFEAIYWANTYPDEVIAVISVDMGLPETAAEMGKVLTPEKVEANIRSTQKLYARIRKRGFLTKLFRNKLENVSGLMTADYLTDDEKKLYEELFYRNLGNDDIFAENRALVSNGEAAGKTGKLKVPAYFYISDMKVPVKHGSWRDNAVRYAESIGAEYKLTDKGHFMYTKIPEQMAENFKEFLKAVL